MRDLKQIFFDLVMTNCLKCLWHEIFFFFFFFGVFWLTAVFKIFKIKLVPFDHFFALWKYDLAAKRNFHLARGPNDDVK